MTINVERRTNSDFHKFFNGSFKEAFDALVTSDGATVTLTVTNAVSGNLTAQFSDGKTIFTGGSTITLTAGSDTSPTQNFIYILKTDPTTLVKSTSSFPAAEHNKIGYFLVPSAGFVQTNGAYINQNWNDFMSGTDDMGHMLHMAEKERRTEAQYFSGISGNGTDNYLTPTAGNVELIATAGIVYQMHEHTYNAFDTSAGDMALVKNWSGDAFHDIANLYDITADSTGATIGNNKYFNLVIWGVGNKTSEYSPMMINLPGGFYNTQVAAEEDVSGFDDFSMSREFNRESSTGFLIARITIQMKTGGGTWIVASTVDLRGQTPNTASGGVGSIVTEFADNAFILFDESDNTKEVAFDVGTNVSTGTTRTFIFPDVDDTLAVVGTNNNFSVAQSIVGDLDVTGSGEFSDGLVDSIDNLSVDIENRQWRDTDGTSVRLDVAQQTLIDGGDAVSIDWGAHMLKDTSANAALDFSSTEVLLFDKLRFTQTDGNEFIDSLADGFMDYGATTQHRFNRAVDVIGNITVSGTVDGIDIATDVAANTTHRSSDGSDHTFLDQSVISGATPTFTGTNITGVPAASILAGTFGTGAYVFDNTVSGITTLTATTFTDGTASLTGGVGTGYTLTSPVLNTQATGTAIKDEDNMASDSAVHLATQQSIKAYVDNSIGVITTSTKTGDYTVTTGDAGTTFIYTGGADGLFTLPSVAAGNIGLTLTFVNTTVNNVRILCADSDTINDSSAGSVPWNVFNDGLDYGVCKLTLITATKWFMMGGSGRWTTT